MDGIADKRQPLWHENCMSLASTQASTPAGWGAGDEESRGRCEGDDVLATVPSGADQGQHADEPVPEILYWQGCLVVTAVFAGYASLFGLQRHLKQVFDIKDDDSPESHAWGFAVSFQYIFNLIFRFAHNIVFGCLSPRKRVLVSMSFMTVAMSIISIVIIALEQHHMYWVAIAYSCGGICIGSFESNVLSSLTPLGHRTKVTAMLGIPLGIVSILVGAFFLMGSPFNVPLVAIYVTVAILNVLGMFLFVCCIPNVPIVPGMEIKGQLGLKKFASDVQQWRRWLPQLWHYPLAMTLDSFSLSCFSPGVAFYIYDKKTVTLFKGWTMQTDSFFAFYNITNMAGSMMGRSLSYKLKPRHALVYGVFNIAGIALLLTRIPLLGPLSTFLIMFGDGLIYGTISKFIDTQVPKEFNLTGISYWLFIGDFGSVLGSNLIPYVRDWVVG